MAIWIWSGILTHCSYLPAFVGNKCCQHMQELASHSACWSCASRPFFCIRVLYQVSSIGIECSPSNFGTVEIFPTQIQITFALCNFKNKFQMFFSGWLIYATHCLLRNYGLAPDGNRVTLWIHKYVVDILGGKVNPPRSIGPGGYGDHMATLP